ncbi:unnamed protein product [Rotaria socialis]|uniref:PiggyBac transposable element-derived protein domain-containing protein n=1 Tax=Rotaria socialis TaxID=392032 RepID=A0A821SRJ0_9BILA|nr:unnamed protein product [Rotaria socialis]
MIGYKGTTPHTSFRQFTSEKLTKREFKVWTRCGIPAFVYEMILHYGTSKTVSNGLVLSDLSSKPITCRSTTTTTAMNNTKSLDTARETLLKQFGFLVLAVLDLVKDAPAGSSIFIDNYFASCKLIKTLAQLGYGVTCTLRSNQLQKCPISTEKQFAKKKRGYYEYFISDNNTCIVIIMNCRRRRRDTKFLLRKPKIQLLSTTPDNPTANDSHHDEENEPPPKNL